MNGDRIRLSRFMSLILRHQPGRFGLSPDEHGFVPLEELLAAIRRERVWERVTEAQVREVVAASDKQRFEIDGERIRARYGHSIPQRVIYPEVEPPEILYHGTPRRFVEAIRRAGLKSMRRQYVHLSTAVEQARQVSCRRDPEPAILKVRARDAWEAGVKFYRPEGRLYLAEAIPAEFIEAADEADGWRGAL